MSKTKRPFISLLALWILISSLSYLVGIAITTGRMQNQRSEVVGLTILGFTISGFLFILGSQILVKNRTTSSSYLSLKDTWFLIFLAITVLWLNVPVSHLGNSLYNRLYSFWSVIVPITVGIATGIFQWIIIFREIRGSIWWIPITTLSFIVSMNISFFIFVFLLDVEMWGGNWYISGAVQGVMYGAFVGILTSIPVMKMLIRSNAMIESSTN